MPATSPYYPYHRSPALFRGPPAYLTLVLSCTPSPQTCLFPQERSRSEPTACRAGCSSSPLPPSGTVENRLPTSACKENEPLESEIVSPVSPVLVAEDDPRVFTSPVRDPQEIDPMPPLSSVRSTRSCSLCECDARKLCSPVTSWFY